MNIRQQRIIELISNNFIETQDELLEYLKEHGFSVAQATISRDIKELGLIKVLDGGKYRYATTEDNPQSMQRLRNLFRECVLSILSSRNIIIIKTLSGSANTAAAVIDKLSYSEILGTIAGDDTLMVIIDENADVENTKDKFKQLLC